MPQVDPRWRRGILMVQLWVKEYYRFPPSRTVFNGGGPDLKSIHPITEKTIIASNPEGLWYRSFWNLDCTCRDLLISVDVTRIRLSLKTHSLRKLIKQYVRQIIASPAKGFLHDSELNMNSMIPDWMLSSRACLRKGSYYLSIVLLVNKSSLEVEMWCSSLDFCYINYSWMNVMCYMKMSFSLHSVIWNLWRVSDIIAQHIFVRVTFIYVQLHNNILFWIRILFNVYELESLIYTHLIASNSISLFWCMFLWIDRFSL